MRGFIERHNARLAAEPADAQSRFVPLPKETDLDFLLAARSERITDSCGAFQFMNVRFQIKAEKGKSAANKKIAFIYSQKIGFVAETGKMRFRAEPVAFLGKGSPPNVLIDLLNKAYMSNAKDRNFKEAE